MPDRFQDYSYSPFPYEDKLQELLGTQPQWQPRSMEELQGKASQFAALQIDPQVQALQRWEPQQAQRDLESAVSRGGARGGGLDWLAAQRQDRFGGELQRLEGIRGDVTAQHLAQLQAQEHARGMEGHQWQTQALQQLAQMAAAHDADQWQRALGVHDRTMLTPWQQHQLNLGYGDLAGEIPPHMVDPYGAIPGQGGDTGTGTVATQNYKVSRGDTLAKIARDHNTTVDELMRLNPQITNRNLIYTGHNIKIPQR